ncbi:hypothetical protein AVEN_163666-1, partial [Araneus ventricosus]
LDTICKLRNVACDKHDAISFKSPLKLRTVMKECVVYHSSTTCQTQSITPSEQEYLITSPTSPSKLLKTKLLTPST